MCKYNYLFVMQLRNDNINTINTQLMKLKRTETECWRLISLSSLKHKSVLYMILIF